MADVGSAQRRGVHDSWKLRRLRQQIIFALGSQRISTTGLRAHPAHFACEVIEEGNLRRCEQRGIKELLERFRPIQIFYREEIKV